MFSSGSKYFLGITGLSLVAAVVYAFTVNPSDLGVIGILGLMVAAALILSIGLKNNEGDAATPEEAIAAATEAPRDSAWPAVFALGLALVLFGCLARCLARYLAQCPVARTLARLVCVLSRAIGRYVDPGS